jgi:hypothetical protein
MKQIDALPFSSNVIHVYDAYSELHFRISKDGHIVTGFNLPITKVNPEYSPDDYSEAFATAKRYILLAFPKFIVQYSYMINGSQSIDFFTYHGRKSLSKEEVIERAQFHLQETLSLIVHPVTINYHREIKPGSDPFNL